MTGIQKYHLNSGKHFGFPECCIEAFSTGEYHEDNPYNGTGYRPCKKCSEVPMWKVVRYINDNRKHPDPFPNSDTFVKEWKDKMYD